ncbi:asparagine synthetase B family protein [Pseudomaricurvus sp.]|uniref:asparagine synthetase B family protein n=1 Tax=Pseudomaricurvus sp. TaxID=2004510 RepID=UPI003F6BC555
MNKSIKTAPGLLSECLYGVLLKKPQSKTPTHDGTDDFSRQCSSLKDHLSTTLSLYTQRSDSFALCSTTSVCSDNDIHAVIIGQPRWTQQELTTIAQKSGHSTALSHAYQQMGNSLLTVLEGNFSFVIIDQKKNTLLSAVDRMGKFPLYFAETDQEFIVASHAGMIAEKENTLKDISRQGIYNYIYFHMIPAPQTAYPGIQKLQAAHSILFSHTSSAPERYWTPTFTETPEHNMSGYAGELKRALGNAVQRALQTGSKTGAFLSGGLDSSTVAGILAEQGGGPVFSIGFSAEGYDEMAYARLTAKHFGLELNEYYVTPEDVVAALPTIAASYDEPFGNSSALPAYFCAKMASEYGIDTLLAGDGGDELFAGNERYAKQSLFEPYLRIPDGVRHSAIEPMLSCFPDATPIVSKMKSYVRQANTPLPGRLHTYNFLHQFDPSDLFESDFLIDVDPRQPGKNQEAVFHAPDEATHLNRMLYLDWQYTLADNDLRKVSHMCALAGVNVQYPMLDDEVVALSCRIPSRWKLKNSLMNSNSGLRHFYKQALTGWLPQETIDKRKQGFGLPFGVWMRTHKPLQELAYDSLNNLKRHGIFRSDFIDRAIRLHREGHAAYYGELVWVLMVLELWLSQHQQPSAMERVA